LGALGSEIGFAPAPAQEARVNSLLAQLKASNDKVTKAVADASKPAAPMVKAEQPKKSRRRKV